MRAIVGAQTIERGSVRIDDADLVTGIPSRWRGTSVICAGPRFEGTVKENISRFATEIDPDLGSIDAPVAAAEKARRNG